MEDGTVLGIIRKEFNRPSDWTRAYYRLKLRRVTSGLTLHKGLWVKMPKGIPTSFNITKFDMVKSLGIHHEVVMVRHGAWAGISVLLIADEIILPA